MVIVMLIKEVKEYERKKGTGIYNYRINISKQDNLDNKVAVMNLSEYDELQDTVKKLNNEIDVKDKKINDLESKFEEIADQQKEVENQQKILLELQKLHHENIEKINNKNNENINRINKEHSEKIENMTTLNTVLIGGLENIQTLGFMDRITNKNKKLANKLIQSNTRKIPKYEFELKENLG